MNYLELAENKNTLQFIKFLLVGVLNTAFGYAAYAFFLYVGLHYSLAALFGTILGILFNFKTTGVFVFKNHNNRLLGHFFLVYGFLYLINVSCLKLFTVFGFTNMYIAGLILMLPLAFLGFLLNKFFVFERKRND